MFRSIQTKTMFFLAAFAVSLLIVTGYLIVFGIEMATEQVLDSGLRDKAVSFSNLVEEARAEDPRFLEKGDAAVLFSDKVAENTFLLGKDGTAIGTKEKQFPYDLNFQGGSDVQEIYKNEMYYISAISKIRGTDWYVVTEETRTEALPSLNLLKTIIIVLVTLILFCLWPLAKKISFQIQRPVRELADAATQIAEGDISHGIEVKEEGELTEIANAFNVMLDNLKSTMQQVLDKSGEAVSMQEIMEYVEETYDNLPGGILSINTLGEITTFNRTAEELTGISAGELIGLNIKNPTPLGIKNLLEPLRKCLSRGSLQLKTLTDIKHANGDIVPVVYSINIQFSLSNEVLGAICVFRRIEDINRFEESAHRVKNLESLGEMAASLAHEIKNPLTSIRGYAQYLRADAEGDGTEELDIILYEVDRLTNMLDRFLNFARPKPPNLKPEDMGSLMQYVATLVNKELPETIRVRTDFSETPKIMADKQMFEPLILNLILNAVQAMPDGGEILLRTYYDKKRDMVCAEVQDNGVGIPQEISEKIFAPFFTTKAEGTGMGLAIASRTVEAHKGVLEVESVVGEMTKFTIMLQAVHDEIKGEEKQKEE